MGSKVSDVVCRLGLDDKIIDSSISQESFELIMDSPFPTDAFKTKLEQLSSDSWRLLKEALQ